MTDAPAQFRLPLLPLIGAALALSVPLSASDYVTQAILLPFLVLSLAGLVLTGYTGQVSLGSVVIMAVGTSAAYDLQRRLGVNMPMSIMLTAAAVGTVFGLPSLRLRVFYLAVSTLAAPAFRAMGADEIRLVFQRQCLGRDFVAAAVTGRDQPGQPWRALLAVADDRSMKVHRITTAPQGLNTATVRDDETAPRAIGVPVLRT